MALITSAASGNFSAGATWTGGVVPTTGDEARASTGHTVTIDVDTTCDEVSNEGTGIFTLASGVTLTANVTNKSATNTRDCVQFTAASPAVGNIVGNCTGAAANQTRGAANTSTGTLNITGNCTAVGLSSFGADNRSTGILNITGNCTGGTGNTSHGANNTSTGTLNITGNCTGGSSSGHGAANNSTGTMLVVGTIEASEFIGGVGGADRQQVTLLTGPFLISPTFGVNPIANRAWRWASALNDQTYLEVGTQTLLEKRNLVTPDNATNFPAASDVRSGTAYGIGGVVTGTCVVPNPAQVAAGTPVDNTVGTLAAASAADIATAVWSATTREITGGTVDTLTNAPASVTPTDIWSHSSRTLTSASGPSAADIRTELDTNSTKLANLDATVSSRLASASYTAPANSDITAIKAKTDNLPSDPADQSLLEAAIAAVTAPSATDVATAVRSELATELAHLDADISTRAVPADIPASDISSIKSTTDALNTDRLAQVSTVATTGSQLAAALS
jgi:hypothetical protein